ncbi:hypothetical protein ACS0TY_019698 [Phlomoides rotata]
MGSTAYVSSTHSWWTHKFVSTGGHLINSVTVTCNQTTSPPKPYLEFSFHVKLEVVQFSLDTKTVVVKQRVFPLLCKTTRRSILVGQQLGGSPFRYSTLYNSLVVIGCKNKVWLLDYGPNPSSADAPRFAAATCLPAKDRTAVAG